MIFRKIKFFRCHLASNIWTFLTGFEVEHLHLLASEMAAIHTTHPSMHETIMVLSVICNQLIRSPITCTWLKFVFEGVEFKASATCSSNRHQDTDDFSEQRSNATAYLLKCLEDMCRFS